MAIRRNCLGFVEDATKIRCVLLLADFARVVAGAGSAQKDDAGDRGVGSLAISASVSACLLQARVIRVRARDLERHVLQARLDSPLCLNNEHNNYQHTDYYKDQSSD
jgi:hypothetical protein